MERKNYYEVHITVRTNTTNDIAKFKVACKEANVKPIVIDLQDRLGNSIYHDVMTSSTVNTNCVDEMRRITSILRNNGFLVVREKLEGSPDNVDNYSAIYYESHIRVRTTVDKIPGLRKLAVNGLHVSRNVFKHLPGDERYMMLTVREDASYVAFMTLLDHHIKQVEGAGFKYDKLEIEKVIYDSDRQSDSAWIRA